MILRAGQPEREFSDRVRNAPGENRKKNTCEIRDGEAAVRENAQSVTFFAFVRLLRLLLSLLYRHYQRAKVFIITINMKTGRDGSFSRTAGTLKSRAYRSAVGHNNVYLLVCFTRIRGATTLIFY